jgi:hypothetical protein
MNKDKSPEQNTTLRDPDLANAEVALRRAAVKAREIAYKAGTSVVYSINGKLVKEIPTEGNRINKNTHEH